MSILTTNNSFTSSALHVVLCHRIACCQEDNQIPVQTVDGSWAFRSLAPIIFLYFCFSLQMHSRDKGFDMERGNRQHQSCPYF
jgi:hypothetical protein